MRTTSILVLPLGMGLLSLISTKPIPLPVINSLLSPSTNSSLTSSDPSTTSTTPTTTTSQTDTSPSSRKPETDRFSQSPPLLNPQTKNENSPETFPLSCSMTRLGNTQVVINWKQADGSCVGTEKLGNKAGEKKRIEELRAGLASVKSATVGSSVGVRDTTRAVLSERIADDRIRKREEGENKEEVKVRKRALFVYDPLGGPDKRGGARMVGEEVY